MPDCVYQIYIDIARMNVTDLHKNGSRWSIRFEMRAQTEVLTSETWTAIDQLYILPYILLEHEAHSSQPIKMQNFRTCTIFYL